MQKIIFSSNTDSGHFDQCNKQYTNWVQEKATNTWMNFSLRKICTKSTKKNNQ